MLNYIVIVDMQYRGMQANYIAGQEKNSSKLE